MSAESSEEPPPGQVILKMRSMRVNIVISVNDKYIDAAKSMLFSLRKHVDEPITVWFLNHSVNMKKTKKFGTFLKKRCNMNLEIIELGTSFFDSMPLVLDDLFTIEIYYRILIPWLLPKEVTRVLWLDADIIISGDISEFYHKDFEGNCMVVCEDEIQINREEKWNERNSRMFGAKHRYFNSGVLLMNTQLMRQKYRSEDIYHISELIKNELFFPDQDLLNYLYKDDILYENYKVYNCSIYIMNKMSEEEFQSVRILHYYGKNKPWNVWNEADPKMLYWKLQKQMGKVIVFPYLIYNCKKKFKNVPWLIKIYQFMRKLIG